MKRIKYVVAVLMVLIMAGPTVTGGDTDQLEVHRIAVLHEMEAVAEEMAAARAIEQRVAVLNEMENIAEKMAFARAMSERVAVLFEMEEVASQMVTELAIEDNLLPMAVGDITEPAIWLGDRTPVVTITNLYDTFGVSDDYYTGDGFSLLIETQDLTMIFDTPYQDLDRMDGKTGTQLNMERLGIDAGMAEVMFLSHEHGSRSCRMFLEDNSDLTVYGLGDIPIGSNVSYYGGEYIEVQGFMRIGEGIYSMGPMEGVAYGEAVLEQVLVMVTEEGLVVVAGCSHPGIETILEEIEKAFPEESILVLYGGLHLKYLEEEKHQAYLDTIFGYDVEGLCLTHCTGNGFISSAKEDGRFIVIDAGAGSVVEVGVR